MRTISKIAVAVSAALVGSAAFALPIGTVYNAKLVVSGSSAFQKAFIAEFKQVCSDTADIYRAAGPGGVDKPNMEAYSCTLSASSGMAAGTKAIAYYRAEGGSVWGVGPIAKSAPFNSVYRVDPQHCTANLTADATGHTFDCPVPAYNLGNDTFGAFTVGTNDNAVLDVSELGVSDEEPAMFVGENWVDANSGSGRMGATAPTTSQLNALTKDSAIGQAFAIYVHSADVAGGGTSINLSRESITSIFSGSYFDWNQVPKADGSGFVVDPNGSVGSLPIVVCERDAGSGTQVGASVYFNAMNCSPAPYAFTASFDENGNPLARNATTGTELSCIAGHPGAIGYAGIQASLTAGTAIVNLDGITPSRVNAANGTYGYWFEGTFNRGAAINTSTAKALASTLITRIKSANDLPSDNTTFALPITGINTPVLPVSTSKPIALGTRGGNSCKMPQNVN